MLNQIKDIVENIINNPAFLINKRSEIITTNEDGRIILDNSNLQEIIRREDDDISNFLKNIFSKAAEIKKSLNKNLSLQINNASKEYFCKATSINISSEAYIILTLQEVGEEEKNNPYRFSINYNEIDKYQKSEEIFSVLQKVRSSYPFTFIGKQKFQKEIDKLDARFWIKDREGKYLVINKAFAEDFGLKNNQIIGKTSQELYNLINREIIKSIDDFILKTSRAVLYELELKGQSEQYLQFPLNDLDGNVVALIGFSIQKEDQKHELIDSTGKYQINYPKLIDESFIVISSKGDILDASELLCDLFSLNSKEIVGSKIEKYLPANVVKEINFGMLQLREQTDYSNSVKLDTPYESEYLIRMKKDFENDKTKAYFISLIEKQEKHFESELQVKMYDIIMHTSPEPMFVYDIESLKFLEVNNAALKLYGYSREEFLEMDLTDLYAPEDIQTLIDSSPSKTTTSEFTGPWRHKHKSGNNLFVEISKSSLEFESKKAHFNIVRDVTKLLDQKKILQRYKSAYDNTRDLIISTDADGFIVDINESVTEKLGYKKTDIQRKPFISLVTDHDRAKVNSEIFHSGVAESTSFYTKLKKSNGNLTDANLYASPIIDYKDEIESYDIIIFLKEKSVESTDRFDKTPADSGESLDSSFLSNLFHELLTPINVIMGFTQEITDNISNPTKEQRESISIIKDNQKLLLQIMDNAVEYSNIQQRKIELIPQNFTFVDIVEEIETNIKKDAESREIDFSYGKISSSLKLNSDKAKITTLATLLVRFAILSTQKKKVYLSAFTIDRDYCIISVRDERSGISRDLLKNMEDIFTGDESIIKQKFGISRFTIRLEKTLVDILGGERIKYPIDNPQEFGVKLPLEFVHKAEVKKETPKVVKPEPVVEQKIEEERIEVKEIKKEEYAAQQPILSESQTQSINVNVNLQADSVKAREEQKQAEVKVIQQTEEPLKTSEKPFVSPGYKEIKEMSCLYVEDQIDSQILFKVQMKDLKSVEFANSFEKALPMLQTRNYDFIVMDINLQGEYNGLDALRAIQKMPSYEKLPIIAVTAYVLPGDREKFIAAGFIDFISKPILKDKMEAILKKIFS